MSDKPQDKDAMDTVPSNPKIEDIAQITNAVIGHLRANPETQKRTENVIQVFLGGALADINPDEKKKFEAEDEGAPPEVIGLDGYIEKKKKELQESGYTAEQVNMILMSELGALAVYTAIANNEKKISIVRRVMAKQIRKSGKSKEAEHSQSKPSTSMGKASASHRDQARFAMRGRGHRGKS